MIPVLGGNKFQTSLVHLTTFRTASATEPSFFQNIKIESRVQWPTPLISALERRRQEDPLLRAILCYTASLRSAWAKKTLSQKQANNTNNMREKEGGKEEGDFKAERECS